MIKDAGVSESSLPQLAIIGSGKGSNMAAIAEACQTGEIPARIALVISDVENAGILNLARGRGLPALFIPPGPFRTKLGEEAEQEYIRTLREAGVDWIILAGFMRILKPPFLGAFPQRVINIHPALLPAFPGLEAWKQALEYGAKYTGCTIHFVDQGVDTGPIIAQAVVPIHDHDTAATLHERIQVEEKKLYPKVITALVRNQIRIEGRRTRYIM